MLYAASSFCIRLDSTWTTACAFFTVSNRFCMFPSWPSIPPYNQLTNPPIIIMNIMISYCQIDKHTLQYSTQFLIWWIGLACCPCVTWYCAIEWVTNIFPNIKVIFFFFCIGLFKEGNRFILHSDNIIYHPTQKGQELL